MKETILGVRNRKKQARERTRTLFSGNGNKVLHNEEAVYEKIVSSQTNRQPAKRPLQTKPTPDVDRMDLPATYDTTRLTLIARDPFWGPT